MTRKSNIPLARKLLEEALDRYKLAKGARKLVTRALRHMTRRRPDFKHPKEFRALTRDDRRLARHLRSKGYSLARICQVLKTGNTGRVSEALNGH